MPGIGRVAALLFLILAGLPPLPAGAGASKQVDLHMVMSMAGLSAGTIKLSLAINQDDAISSVTMKSTGMVKLVTGYKGKSQARSSLPDGSWPMPISYDSYYETNNADREVRIRYDPAGGAITDLKTWKRGEPRETRVPGALQLETIDPLTAMLRIRHWVLALRDQPAAAAQQTFEVFDGRRRFRLEAEILDRRTVEFDDKPVPALQIKVRMEPLAGFNENDLLANWSSEDGDRWIELVVTDDENPVPLSLETKGGSLKTTIVLEKICAGEGQCRAFSS